MPVTGSTGEFSSPWMMVTGNSAGLHTGRSASFSVTIWVRHSLPLLSVTLTRNTISSPTLTSFVLMRA